MTAQACAPTGEAVTRQIGLYENVNNFEGYAKKEVLKSSPENAKKLAGIVAVGYKFSNDKQTKFSFQFPELCDIVELGVSKQTNTVNFKWNF